MAKQVARIVMLAACVGGCATEGRQEFKGTVFRASAPTCVVDQDNTDLTQKSAVTVQLSDIDPYKCRTATVYLDGAKCTLPLNSLGELAAPHSECREDSEPVQCGPDTVKWAVTGLVGGGLAAPGSFRLFVSILTESAGGASCTWFHSTRDNYLNEQPE